MHKLIFDRSIFHRDKFTQLKESKFLHLLQRNKLKLFFTPIFLEETLGYDLVDKNVFKDQWKFLLSLKNTKWFKQSRDIVDLELGNQPCQSLYYLIPKREVIEVIEKYFDYNSNIIPTGELNNILNEIKYNGELRHQYRKARLGLRDSIPFGNYNLETYFEENISSFIETVLMVHHNNAIDYLNNWRIDKRKYKFTNSFIKAYFATFLLPIINRNLKVDVNDWVDAEQLAYLLWTDIMVSDDKFMKECFKLLYPDNQKKFLTLPEFFCFLESLN